MKYFIILVALSVGACNSNSSKEDSKKEDTTKQVVAPPVEGKIDIESFGDLKIGQHYKETLRVLGDPGHKSKPIEWEADGLMHEDWNYGAKGLMLNMAAEYDKRDSTLAVFTITATPPCAMKTRANMGIGNTIDEVRAAYKRDINNEMSNEEQVVVGEIYGGIIFTFGTDKKVNRVFLGAAAE
jgi:hypothetical protein